MDAATRPLELSCEPLPIFSAVDDGALLREALAFIGDLDVEWDSATLDENDDQLTGALFDSGRPLPQQEAPRTELLLYAALQQPPASAQSWSSGEKVKSEAVSESVGTSLKPKMINRSRVRQRAEVEYLRGLIGDLEERLSGLVAVREDNTSNTDTIASSELVDAWAQVALHQYEQSQQSEEENVRLKRLLDEQIQLGKALERLLTKTRPEQLAPFQTRESAHKRARRSNPRTESDEMVFDELLADCASLYSQTEQVLARFDAVPPTRPLRHVKLVHDPHLGMMIQIDEHRILPFEYEDTVSVVWNSFLDASVSNSGYHKIRPTEDTLKVRCQFTSEIGRARGEFAAKFTARLYVEASRTVIVVSAIFDPTEVSKTNMTGVRTRYTGWHVIEPMPVSRGPSRSGATKMAVYYQAVPDVDDALLEQTRKVGTLTNFLLSTLAVEIESRSQNVDNRLLELSLRRGRSGF